MKYIDDLVSVVIPSYNAEKYIESTIYSVLSQTYLKIEIIIVDDVSSDDTIHVLKKFEGYPNVKLIISKEKLYTAGARNLGILNSSGRYIAFIDSDDLWKENKIETQLNALKSTESIICYTGVKKINSEGSYIANLYVPNEISYNELLKGNKICCSSVLIDRVKISNLSFDSNFKIVEDYALWLRILRETKTSALGVNEPLTEYRIHKNAKTSNKLIPALDTWNVLRKSEKLRGTRLMRAYILYIIEGFSKIMSTK